MKIRYMGTRLQKKVNVAGRDLLFNPTCELNPIFDIEIIKWLLHRDRQGLFVVIEVEDKIPSVTQPEMTRVAGVFAETPVVAPQTEKKDTSQRGRPKKKR